MLEPTMETSASGIRATYSYQEPTRLGERLEVEFVRCDNPGGAHSLPALWHSGGHTESVLESWWCVRVYATDQHGDCRGRYNPTEKLCGDGKRMVHDFAWMLEATDDNRDKILREIERRAF